MLITLFYQLPVDNRLGILERIEYFLEALISLQALLHKLSLGKADPPLARLSVVSSEDLLAHSVARLLSKLLQVLPHGV